MSPKQTQKKSKPTVMDVKPVKRRPLHADKTSASSSGGNKAVIKTPRTKKTRKSLINRIFNHPLRSHPFALPVVTFILLSFFAMTVFVASNGRTIGASDTRLVTLRMDGVEQVIPTRAQTVKEFFERLDIEVKEKDIVEPALDAEIIDSKFSVDFFKARPVTIIDGDEEITAVIAAPTPRVAAEQAGVKVYPEDKIETRGAVVDTEDVLRGDVVAETIVIDRATPAIINLYGSNIPVRTHVATVGEALKEKNIQTLPDDVITPSLDTPLTPRTQIFVTRVGKQIDAREETIAMPVETINDPNLLAGATQIRQQGTPGRKVVTYEVQLQNGAEVTRKIIQEIIALEPIKQIVVKGTKVVYSNPSENVALGRQIADQMGWGHEFSCIYQIFDRESRWNHAARNRSSGAYGIPQALPGNKMGPGWESDPAVQIRWGIGYMVSRYGSPCRANGFWQINHWY